MKPVINFQIPNKQSIGSAAQLKAVLSGLQKKLAKDYDVIITPWQMQADNMVNIVIDDNTDIEYLVRRLKNMECRDRYKFHEKYMESSLYNHLDYDGDLRIHPIDAMKDWWMPIIEMCNFSKLTNSEIFEYLYENDINPLALVSVTGDDIDSMHMDLSAVAHRPVNFKMYIRWMISWINNSKKSPADIMELIDAAGIDPLLIVSIDDKDEGFPWTILDENVRISLGSDIDAQHLRAATERRKNRRDIHVGGGTI